MTGQTSHIMGFVHRARIEHNCGWCHKTIKKGQLEVIFNYPHAYSSGMIFHAECEIANHVVEGVELGIDKSRGYWHSEKIFSIKQLEDALRKTSTQDGSV